jgi:hypothetical protein
MALSHAKQVGRKKTKKMAQPQMPAPLGGYAAPPPAASAAVGSGPGHGVPVTVNVYTLMSKEAAHTRVSNDVLDLVGMSIYHAGVEIFGQEYAFGMDPSQRPDPNIDGIFAVPPRQAVGDFKEAVVVGHMPPNFTPQAFQGVLNELRPIWRAVTYHILERNCCHFAKALCVALNPTFERTFPNYVCRIASVGSTVVPDALVKKLTTMIAPPPAIPPSLVNVVDIAFEGPVPPPPPPPPGTQQQAQPAPAAKASGNIFKSAGLAVLSVTKMAAGAVGDAVGSFVTESDRRTYAAKFPGNVAANLRTSYTTSVSYCFREYEAELYIATDCICLTGPPQMNVIIPMSDIVCIHPAKFTPPPAPRLPPVFALTNEHDPQFPAVFIFRRSRPNAVTPLFLVRTMTSGISEKVSSAMQGGPRRTATQEATLLMEKLWYESRGGQ